MKHHHLKSIPKHFASLKSGQRVAEVRRDDRGFEIEDGITFHEIGTQETQTAIITYLDDFGCQHGYVNISLGNFGALIV